MPAAIKLTDEQIKFLHKNIPIYGQKWCAEKLNMSSSTLKKKGYKLGLYNKPKIDYINKIFPIHEKSAYFLGFFFGDGYVISQDNNLNGINIEINSEDAEDLKNTFDFLPWRITNRQRNDWMEVTRFNISSRELATYMTDLGFREKHKKFIDVNNIIPNNLLYLFLHGYLDADGHIKCRNHGSVIQFAGPYDFDWSKFIDITKKIMNINIFKFKKDTTNIEKNHRNSKLTSQNTPLNIKFLDYIYQNGNKYGLSRKYNEYLKLKEKYN